MGIIDDRRRSTKERLESLQSQLGRASEVLQGKACVYLTGSVARGEAGKYSDLDLFIVGLEDNGQRQLSKLDEIIVKADLISKSRELNFPDFSGDGEYLTHYTLGTLKKNLGNPKDDAENTFTARLLLLLESHPLLGEQVYKRIIDEVIAAYWRDFAEHAAEFCPAFLANDIVRMWKTFCVNYEARTEKDPPEKLAKRKLFNYKLKHSRMLTCYSGLLYLLWVCRINNTVTPDDAKHMVSLTPTQRLEWLKAQEGSCAHLVDELLAEYEAFLVATDARKDDLLMTFSDREKTRERMRKARDFSECMFKLIVAVGHGSPLYQFLMV